MKLCRLNSTSVYLLHLSGLYIYVFFEEKGVLLMKKGIFPFVSPLLLIVMLVAAVGYVAVSAGAAPLHRGPHFFFANGSSQQPTSTANAAATTNPNLTYNGGPVVAGTMHAFLIFWEPSPLPPGTTSVSANYHSLIQRYFGDVGGSPLYQNNQQYTDAQGRFPSGVQLGTNGTDGVFIDTTTPYPTQSVPATIYPNFLIATN